MRREVLYQYDLPIEILDAVPADEEVFHVLFGRSKEKWLIPILFSNKRILWGYPETDTVYKVFEQHYIDVVSASAKFPPALSPTITIQTKTQSITFPNIQDTVEDVRGMFVTLTDELKMRTGTYWELLSQKNLLTEEYLVKNNPEIDISACSDDDLFEETARSTKPMDTSPHETLFSHFPAEEEDVFADETMVEDREAAIDERVSRLVEITGQEMQEEPAAVEMETDTVIYESAGLPTNEQWHLENTGDAEILPRGRPWKAAPASTAEQPQREVFSPEDDDSEVYVSSISRPKLVVPQPKSAVVMTSTASPLTETVEVVETVEILPPSIPMKKKEKPAAVEIQPDPVMIQRKAKPLPADAAIPLQPKDGIDEDTIEKSLDALKFLRDNNIISEAEYKKRSLSLFENGDSE